MRTPSSNFEQFTLGIEEEFQIVDPETRELRSHVSEILEEGKMLLGEQVKPEMIQSMIEVGTGVCKDITEARSDITNLRRVISELVSKQGLVILAAGHSSIFTLAGSKDFRELKIRIDCRRESDHCAFAANFWPSRSRWHCKSRACNTNHERDSVFASARARPLDLIAVLAWCRYGFESLSLGSLCKVSAHRHSGLLRISRLV